MRRLNYGKFSIYVFIYLLYNLLFIYLCLVVMMMMMITTNIFYGSREGRWLFYSCKSLEFCANRSFWYCNKIFLNAGTKEV